MTSLVSPVTVAAILGSDYDALSASVGLVAILLLIVLLVGQELVRVHQAPARVIRAFDAPIFTLLGATGIILSLRLVDLLT